MSDGVLFILFFVGGAAFICWNCARHTAREAKSPTNPCNRGD